MLTLAGKWRQLLRKGQASEMKTKGLDTGTASAVLAEWCFSGQLFEAGCHYRVRRTQAPAFPAVTAYLTGAAQPRKGDTAIREACIYDMNCGDTTMNTASATSLQNSKKEHASYAHDTLTGVLQSDIHQHQVSYVRYFGMQDGTYYAQFSPMALASLL